MAQHAENHVPPPDDEQPSQPLPSPPPEAQSDSRAVNLQDLVEKLGLDQCHRWNLGQRVPSEAYLHQHPEIPLDSDYSFELVYGEFLLRESCGDPATLEEFLWRFPAHTDRLNRQLTVHRQLDSLQTLKDDLHSIDTTQPALPPPPQGPRPAVEVPGYEVLEELGRGGMGVVYRARQTRLEREVALKMVRPDGMDDREMVARLLSEARAVARLKHPNIVQIFAVGDHDGRPFIEMEYLEGGSLGRLLDGRPWPARDAARLIERLALAISEAHRLGIVHRDLKPGNVLFSADGTVKIADFGLAKLLDRDSDLTRSEQLLGSPSYMPPEQTHGSKSPLPARADIYSLGAILYELLTGRPPFRGNTVLQTLEQVRSSDPVPPARLVPQIPKDLETICLKCLVKEPARRYESAAALAEDLRRFLEDRPILARRVGPVELACRRLRRYPVVAALVAALMVSLIGGFLGMAVLLVLANHNASVAREKSGLARRETRRAVESSKAEAHSRREAEQYAALRTLDRGHDLAERGSIGLGLLWIAEAHRLTPPDALNLRKAIARDALAWSRVAARPRALWSVGSNGDSLVLAVSPDSQTAVVVREGGTAEWIDLETARTIRILREKNSHGNYAEFSPEGNQALVVGYDEGVVRVYDLSGGSRDFEIQPKTGKPNFAYFVLGGRAVLTNDRTAGQFDLWDARTGEQLAISANLKPGSSLLDRSPDGRFFATASGDSLVRLWDAETLRERYPPLRHGLQFTHARFGPLGRRLVTWDSGRNPRSGHLLLHDLEHPDRPAVSLAASFGVRNVGFRRDAMAIAVAGEDGTIRILDSLSGEPVAPILRAQAPVLPFENFVPQFSPDGQVLLTAHQDASARLWDLAAGRPLGAVIKHQVAISQARLLGDGEAIATAGRDGRVLVWDLAGALAPSRVVPMPSMVKTAALSHDGSTLAVADFQDSAWCVDLGSGRPVSLPMSHNRLMAFGGPFTIEGVIRTLAFGPASSGLIVSGGDDATARIWNLDGRPRVRPLSHPHWVMRSVFSPDGRWMLAATPTNSALLWDLQDPDLKPRLLTHSKPEILHVAFAGSETALTLSSASDDHLSWWNVRTGEMIGRLGGFGSYAGPVWTSSDGRLGFVLSPAQGCVHVLDLKAGSRLRRIGSGVRVACSDASGRLLLVGRDDRSAQLWDVNTGHLIGSAMEHPAAISAVALSPDGTLALTGAEDGRLRLWDTSTGLAIGPPLAHGPTPRQVFFSHDGRTALGVGLIVTAHAVPGMLDAKTASVTELAESVATMQLDPDGQVRTLKSDRWKPPLDLLPPLTLADLHDRLATLHESNHQLDAALWHLDRLMAARPDDHLAQARRDRVSALSGHPVPQPEPLSHAPEPLRPWRAVQALNRFRDARDAGDDRASVEALDELIAAGADSDSLRLPRAFARIHLGLGPRAADDLHQALHALPDRFSPTSHAVCLVLANDLQGYQAFCQSLASISKDLSPGQANMAARILSLGPSALDNPQRAENLARRALEGASTDEERRMYRNTLGATLYRAGRYRDAIETLKHGISFVGTAEAPRSWAFLAMAEAALGETAAARRWLDRFPADTSWTRSVRSISDLEILLLWREAQAKVLDSAFPRQPFASPAR